jgi:hypothetical protein
MMMISKVMDPRWVNLSGPSTAAEQSPPVFPLSNPPWKEKNLAVLAAQCLQEIEWYRREEPYMESSSVGLLRRTYLLSYEAALGSSPRGEFT